MNRVTLGFPHWGTNGIAESEPERTLRDIPICGPYRATQWGPNRSYLTISSQENVTVIVKEAMKHEDFGNITFSHQ
ncbi:hypothetical protein PV326_009003 [Microctonus aethiopoides]|nr:hypothetical protein PV326_009003 [Microctonus aethiopoides]